MSKLRENLTKMNYFVENFKEYDYKKHLNWRDDGNDSADGQGVEDPSINDFIKGYNIDPYELRQWAKLTKKAIREVDVLQFTPEYLADKILKLWNTTDGLLQNFYDSFTIRYNNKLKKAIAEEIKKRGYVVYPLLIDDMPKYAKHQNIIKKLVKTNKLQHIMEYSKTILGEHQGLQKFIDEIEQLQQIDNKPVTRIDASALIEYYNRIFPEDYALHLVTTLIDEPEKTESRLYLYKDFNISDESLQAMEDYLSGNADPLYINDGGVGGYDFTSDTRMDSTAPNNYEVTSKKKQ